uniref:CocE/NonD family hydrolase n=1 Tax=Prauserella endophytica TaxID=1592324 RepID=UPI00197E935F|nr:CocE/NonD family hydrolase [Prauserella endophytica]
MRDGVRLATDVYLPDADGPVPVVLTRLPYDKNGEIIRVDVFAEALLERGYALAAQDRRGKFPSRGRTVVSERPDCPMWATHNGLRCPRTVSAL